MSIVLIVVLAIALLVAAVLVLASTRPDTFALERSADIAAAPERIFPLIDDLRAHEAWSPFARPDPKVRKRYDGPAHGTDATVAWDGKGGSGRLTITESVPASRSEMRLEMLKPISCSNRVAFTLQPAGGATRVTWRMEGAVPFAAKICHLFFNMDRVVGGQFDDGLAGLKACAER